MAQDEALDVQLQSLTRRLQRAEKTDGGIDVFILHWFVSYRTLHCMQSMPVWKNHEAVSLKQINSTGCQRVLLFWPPRVVSVLLSGTTESYPSTASSDERLKCLGFLLRSHK